MQNGIAPQHPHQAARSGDGLGEHRGQRRAEDVQVEGQDENHVQHDVQQRRAAEPDHRRPAVPQGPEDAGCEVIEKISGKPGENGEDIEVGPLINLRGRLHPREDVAAEKGGGQGCQGSEEQAQPRAAGDIPPQLPVIPRAELLGRRDSEAAAEADAEAHHQNVDAAGGAHCCQGAAPQGLAHNGGIHYVVKLLEQVPKENRESEAENQPHGAAFC